MTELLALRDCGLRFTSRRVPLGCDSLELLREILILFTQSDDKLNGSADSFLEIREGVGRLLFALLVTRSRHVLCLLQRSFGLIDQLAECAFVAGCYIGQYLAVQVDTRLVQAIHEPSIRNARGPAGGADPNDPQR